MISALLDYLAMFYQSGNLEQVAVIARSMLAAIPDVVALQFLALALYQMGRTDVAYQLFNRVAIRTDHHKDVNDLTYCESASVVSYREATRAHSGLADGWYRIALAMKSFGLHLPAARAFEAAAASRGGAGDESACRA